MPYNLDLFAPPPPRRRRTVAEKRDDALARVERGTRTAWQAKGWAVILALAATGKPWGPDDFWLSGIERPRESRALGPLMMRAVRLGIIERTGGLVSYKLPSRNGAPIVRWIGTGRQPS